jgi:hypothetical protein
VPPASAFSAQLGSVTYYAVTRSYGHPAYIEMRGARRGLKRLDLGTYVKLEQAKQACERHYRNLFLHRESLVCRFNCTVASTASIRSRPFAMA